MVGLIITAIIIGIIIAVIIISCFFLDKSDINGFDTGMVVGVVITVLISIEIGLVSSIIEKPTLSAPSALDVYRGNTELEITSVNGTPIDTVVVFKKN